MPKVELHVHLEGSIRPETLLQLAQRNHVALPADTVQGLREWYRFRDFEHFVEIYQAISKCIRTADDIELITREFLQGQADQNILHTEATFTAQTILIQSGVPLDDQLAAINRAREWAEKELNVTMGVVIDIIREWPVEDGLKVAEFAIANKDNGVCALGLSGIEKDTEPKKHAKAFGIALESGLPITTHAGETQGPWSIWGCLNDLGANRIGHGVRCLEDPALVQELCERSIPLEVCPSSNVCLGIFPSFEQHPLPKLLDAGLVVTINSDDPPMFGTTLTEEFIRCAEAFGFNEDILWSLTWNAARSSFLPDDQRRDLGARLRSGFSELIEEEE